MSYHSNFSTSNGTASGVSSQHIIPPQAIRSAISAHHHNSARIGDCLAKVPPRNDFVKRQNDLDAATRAYFGGQMSGAEFDAVLDRAYDTACDWDRRVADFDARERAGLTKPSDWFKEFHGLTDNEAEERLREGVRLSEMRRANEERNQSRMLQQSRHGRGF